MTELTYRIWFEPTPSDDRPAGGACFVPDPDNPDRALSVHQRATAETLIEKYRTVNNPAWAGTFSVVEHMNGRPL